MNSLSASPYTPLEMQKLHLQGSGGPFHMPSYKSDKRSIGQLPMDTPLSESAKKLWSNIDIIKLHDAIKTDEKVQSLFLCYLINNVGAVHTVLLLQSFRLQPNLPANIFQFLDGLLVKAMCKYPIQPLQESSFKPTHFKVSDAFIKQLERQVISEKRFSMIKKIAFIALAIGLGCGYKFYTSHQGSSNIDPGAAPIENPSTSKTPNPSPTHFHPSTLATSFSKDQENQEYTGTYSPDDTLPLKNLYNTHRIGLELNTKSCIPQKMLSDDQFKQLDFAQVSKEEFQCLVQQAPTERIKMLAADQLVSTLNKMTCDQQKLLTDTQFKQLELSKVSAQEFNCLIAPDTISRLRMLSPTQLSGSLDIMNCFQQRMLSKDQLSKIDLTTISEQQRKCLTDKNGIRFLERLYSTHQLAKVH